ncbi:MAG: hypothetical protein ACE368_07525 [Paracoccaceae bacterium]
MKRTTLALCLALMTTPVLADGKGAVVMEPVIIETETAKGGDDSWVVLVLTLAAAAAALLN